MSFMMIFLPALCLLYSLYKMDMLSNLGKYEKENTPA